MTDTEEVARDALERRSFLATIRGLHINKWILGLTALAAVVGVGGLVVATWPQPDQPTQGVNGTGNVVNQNSGTCGQVNNNSTCVVQLQQSVAEADRAAADEAKFKAELAKRAQQAPAGSGPWPFVVVDTVIDGRNLGLYARTTNQVNGARLGNAANRSIIWADCVATSDYTPPDVTGDNNVGPQWLRVRWAPVDPTQRSVSEPTDARQAWMYRGATVPLEHNGAIPACG